MPDVLILTRDEALSERLSAMAAEYKFRVKCTAELDTALEWFKTRPFDIVLSDPSYTDDQLERISVKLWEHNPSGPIVIVITTDIGAQELSRKRFEWSLLGASFVEGPRGMEDLRNVLVKIAASKLKSGLQFRVLVVEDLDSPRDIICSFVEHVGYPGVQGVGSAKEALSILDVAPGKFSCIITDINMPYMNGKQLIDAVRAHRKLKHIPIIVLTAYGTVDNLLECLQAGASGFLVKPPSKKELNRELGRALRIMEEQGDPRLTIGTDIEALKEMLLERGFN